MCFRNAAIKDTFREASRRLSRFFSIFAIVAIGVGFFVGIKATSPDMKLTADAYYKETNLMDIRLISPLGFEEEDVSAVLYTEGVESVMPSYSMDALMSIRGKNTVVKIHAIPKAYGSDAPLNVPALVSGRMPVKSGECVIEENNVRNPFTFRLGDGIRLIPSSDDDVLSDKLKTDAFTIVGFVNSPEYISMERGVSTIGSGSVNCYIMIPPEDFNFEVYTEIHAGLAWTREISTFSEEYASIAAAAKKKLTALGEERGVIRYNHVKDEATEKIDEGKTKLADAEAEMEQKLSEAQAEIDAAREKINTAEKDLADGEAKFKTEIADAEKQLADGYDQYYKSKAQYDKEYAAFQSTKKDAEAQIASGERDLNQLGAQIDQLQSVFNSMSFFDPQRIVVFGQLTMMQYQYSQGTAQLNQAKSDLAAGEQKLKDADKQLKSNKRKLDESKEELEQAKIDTQKQIDDARTEIENAKLELADGEKKFAEKKAEAEQKINDARKDIADAEEQLADLEVPEWLVLTREDNPGYSGYKENAERLDGVASLFPLFFLLVAGLVCLTTMMRMVEEQRGQIGIYKALGYSRAAIASKYFSYAMVAALFGSLLGILIGHILFPKVIYNAFDVLYSLPPLLIAMPWSIAAASAAVAVASTAFAAVIACDTELRLMPASLMRPKAQKPGKRVFVEKISSVWSRLSFISKITARNLLRYKIRFLMTLLGISGCMALMVAGFGLKDSVNLIVPRQFGEIDTYDVVFKLKDGLSEESMAEVKKQMSEDDRVSQAMFVGSRTLDAVSKNEKTQVELFVPQDPEQIGSFIKLRERVGGKPIVLGNKGAVITEKLAEMHGLKPGDDLTLSENGSTFTVRIEGITENYVQHYVYMTPQCYKKAMGEEPVFNTVITLTYSSDAETKDALIEDWLLKDSMLVAYRVSAITEEFADSIDGLNVVVLVMIISAGILAFVVLYNLTNINISERVREIATIKVLGFYNNEVSKFVFRENIILSVFGIAAGSVFGVILHKFVVQTSEVDLVMFGRGVGFVNFIYAGLLTLLFTFAVNFIMHYRLKKISMVESLKSLD